jgi:hypothetical protein
MLIVSLMMTVTAPVNANNKNSIVIIDTAIDTTAPELKGKIIYEVCLMDEFRCPNKQQVMEGVGSATLPLSQIYQNGFDHGTTMSKIAATVNSNINIVFIRIVPINTDGTKAEYTDYTVRTAMKWALENKSKFNITAVSVSHGAMRTPCPTNPEMINLISDLQKVGVASLFATGNKGNLSDIDYPACVNEAVAIGWANEDTTISSYSNSNSSVDFYALGTYALGRGSSAATAAFASYWAKVYKGNYLSTYDYIKSVAKPVSGTKGQSGLFVDVYRSENVQTTPQPAVTPQTLAIPQPVVTTQASSTPKPAATPQPVVTPQALSTPQPVVTPNPIVSTPADINLLPYTNERLNRLCTSRLVNKYVNHPEGYRLTCKSSGSDKMLRWRQ